VTIGKELQGLISFSNQMRCCVESIEQGALVSVVRLRSGRWMMESLITTVTLERMALGVGDEVTALIKASALSIVECLDV
jgi:molybdopterin-binding protein